MRGPSRQFHPRGHPAGPAHLEWLHRRENLVVCGPSGTGKTFLLEALGSTTVEQGLKVAWLTLEDLGGLVPPAPRR